MRLTSPARLLAIAWIATASAGTGGRASDPVSAEYDLRAPLRAGFNDPNAIKYDSVRYRRFVARERAIASGPIVCGSANYNLVTSEGEFAGQADINGAYLGERFDSRQLIQFLENRARREPPIPPRELSHDSKRPDTLQPWDSDVASVINLLGGVQAVEAAPAITRLLRDPSPAVRDAAVIALGNLGPGASPGTTELIPFLAVKQHRSAAVYSLTRIGKGAVPTLVQALHEGDADTRTYAAEALGKIGPDANEAVASLIDRLGDRGHPATYAAIALERVVGPENEEAIPALERAVTQREPDVRRHAAAALSAIGPAATPALSDLLTHPDSHVRLAVANSWQPDPSDTAALNALARATEDADSYVRKLAARALGEAKKLAATIDAARSGPEEERPQRALELASRPRSPAALNTLINLLDDHSNDVAAAAATALGNVGTHSPLVIPALTRAAEQGVSPVLRVAANRSLQKLCPRRRVRV